MPDEIRDVAELLARAELGNVVVHKVRGERQNAVFREEYEQAARDRKEDDPTWADDEEDPVVLFNIGTRVEDSEIGVLARIIAVTFDGEFEVEAEAVFSLSSPASVAPEVVQEFVERVGVMAVYPYIRSTIAGIAAQMGIPAPTLRLLRTGEVSLRELAPGPSGLDDDEPPF